MNVRLLFALTIFTISLVAVNSASASTEPVDPVCKNEAIKATEPLEVLPQPTPVPLERLTEIAAISSDKRSWTKFKYRRIINEVAGRYDLDPQLIYATIMTESHGREYVYRFEPHLGEGSYCMGQILLSTAWKLGFTGPASQLYQPKVCIDMIGRYHRLMLNTYGELTAVQLARAYNTGSPWKRPVWGHLNRFRQWMNETT